MILFRLPFELLNVFTGYFKTIYMCPEKKRILIHWACGFTVNSSSKNEKNLKLPKNISVLVQKQRSDWVIY